MLIAQNLLRVLYPLFELKQFTGHPSKFKITLKALTI